MNPSLPHSSHVPSPSHHSYFQYRIRQVHNIFQTVFSKQCNLVLPLSNFSNVSFLQTHPGAYVYFLVLSSLLSFRQKRVLDGSSYARCNKSSWPSFVLLYEGCPFITLCHSGFGGLEVACWPLVPNFVGSHPAEAVGFLGRKKILSTPSFGGEVNPSVPCRSVTACKRSLNVTWK